MVYDSLRLDSYNNRRNLSYRTVAIASNVVVVFRFFQFSVSIWHNRYKPALAPSSQFLIHQPTLGMRGYVTEKARTQNQQLTIEQDIGDTSGHNYMPEIRRTLLVRQPQSESATKCTACDPVFHRSPTNNQPPHKQNARAHRKKSFPKHIPMAQLNRRNLNISYQPICYASHSGIYPRTGRFRFNVRSFNRHQAVRCEIIRAKGCSFAKKSLSLRAMFN